MSSSTSLPTVYFMVLGSIDQYTGGYIYDKEMVAGIRAAGYTVVVLEVPDDTWDSWDATDIDLSTSLTPIVIVDGLLADRLSQAARKVLASTRLLALIHHPSSLESGLSQQQKDDITAHEQALIDMATSTVVTSTSTQAIAADLYANLPHDDIHVVLPGTPDAYTPSQPGQSAYPDTDVLLLTVAHHTPRKDHASLVRALSILADDADVAQSGVSYLAVCIGSQDRDPHCFADLQSLTAELDVAHLVRFLGEVDEDTLMQTYADCTAYVHPALYEGYGMALALGLRNAKPIVCTTGGATTEVIPSDAALFVEPGDYTALAQALKTIIIDKDATASLQAGAQKAAAALPSWAQSGQQFAHIVATMHADA